MFILTTEQYPEGLGKTVSEVKTELEGMLPIEKVSFSCYGAKTVANAIYSRRKLDWEIGLR